MNSPPTGTLRFPPLGNPLLGRIGVADVAEHAGFDELSEALASLPVGPIEMATGHAAWLEQAIQQANDSSYRFDLRHVHGQAEPNLVDLNSVDGSSSLGGLRLATGRGTAKLVVLLGVFGEGRVEVSAAGVAQNVELGRGTLVVAPAYLCLTVTRAVQPLLVISTTVHGPAFR